MESFPTPIAAGNGRRRGTGRQIFQRRKWDVEPGMIGAGIAETDFGTSPAISRALHNAVEQGFLTYLPEGLAREAEHACADFLHHRFGWPVAKERVQLVSDVLAGFALVATLLTDPGTKIIVPTPCYMPFLTEPAKLGREVIQIPMARTEGRWTIPPALLEQAFRDGAGLLVLCNPHNPLGQVMTKQEQQEVAVIVARHGGRVFEDAIHAPVVYPGTSYLPYAQLSPVTAAHTVTAIATSKGWNVPGLKAAQLILSSDADLERWHRHDPVPSLRGSILGAVATIAAYRDSVDWLDELTRALQANRDYFAASVGTALPQIDFTAPQATYLAWLGLAGHGLANPATYLSRRADVQVTDGAGCGDGFESFVRFNFALRQPVLEDATTRLIRALDRDTHPELRSR